MRLFVLSAPFLSLLPFHHGSHHGCFPLKDQRSIVLRWTSIICAVGFLAGSYVLLELVCCDWLPNAVCILCSIIGNWAGREGGSRCNFLLFPPFPLLFQKAIWYILGWMIPFKFGGTFLSPYGVTPIYTSSVAALHFFQHWGGVVHLKGVWIGRGSTPLHPFRVPPMILRCYGLISFWLLCWQSCACIWVM